jgi:hypothetical protein
VIHIVRFSNAATRRNQPRDGAACGAPLDFL